MPIIVHYSSLDDQTPRPNPFPTFTQAQEFAHRMVGEHPEMGSSYAVSGDGIGKVTVEGCTLKELFPDA